MSKEKFLEKVKKNGFNAVLERGVVKVYVKSANDIEPTFKEVKKLVEENKYDKSFGVVLETNAA